MMQDCRADKAEGWSYFLIHYIPVIQTLITRYFPERGHDTQLLDRVLVSLRNTNSSLFHSLDPAPERHFVAELRQRVVAELAAECAAIGIEALTALEPLTTTAKQVVWLQTMHYGKHDIGTMLRMSPATVEKISAQAAELASNPRLCTSVSQFKSEQCVSAKALLDVIDGRSTWSTRDELERHIQSCWYCIDHFCRLREVCFLLSRATPLSEQEAERFKSMLGLVATDKRSLWKRMLAR
jgi:hypothetical protein